MYSLLVGAEAVGFDMVAVVGQEGLSKRIPLPFPRLPRLALQSVRVVRELLVPLLEQPAKIHISNPQHLQLQVWSQLEEDLVPRGPAVVADPEVEQVQAKQVENQQRHKRSQPSRGFLLMELHLEPEVLVVLTTQTCGMTKMITGLVEVVVARLAQVQDRFRTEHLFRLFQTIPVQQQLAEEAAMGNLYRGLHQLLQVI
jgi:hypothetical protein